MRKADRKDGPVLLRGPVLRGSFKMEKAERDESKTRRKGEESSRLPEKRKLAH